MVLETELTFDDLRRLGYLTAEMAATARDALWDNAALFVCGGAGSGRTTLLNALLFEAPAGATVGLVELEGEPRRLSARVPAERFEPGAAGLRRALGGGHQFVATDDARAEDVGAITAAATPDARVLAALHAVSLDQIGDTLHRALASSSPERILAAGEGGAPARPPTYGIIYLHTTPGVRTHRLDYVRLNPYGEEAEARTLTAA